MRQTVIVIVGIILVGAGIAGYFLLPNRGDVYTLAMAVLGAFLVDKSAVIGWAAALRDLFLGGKSG